MSGILRIEVWEIHSPCSARLREWDGCLPQACGKAVFHREFEDF